MKTLALVGVMALLVLVAGCGGGGGGGGVPGVAPGGTTGSGGSSGSGGTNGSGGTSGSGGSPSGSSGGTGGSSVYSGLGAEAVFGVQGQAGFAGTSPLTWGLSQPITNVLTGPLLQEVGPMGPGNPPVVWNGGSLAQLIEVMAEMCSTAQHPNPSQGPASLNWLDPATNVQWVGDMLNGLTDATATIHGTGPGVDCTLTLHLTYSQGLGVTLQVGVDGTVATTVTPVTDWTTTPPTSVSETGQEVLQGSFTINVKSSQLWEGGFTLTSDLTGQEQYNDGGSWVTCQTDHNGAVLVGNWNTSRLTITWSGSLRTDYAPADSGLWATHTLGGSVVQLGTDGVFLLDTPNNFTGDMTDSLLLSSGIYGTVRMDVSSDDSGLGLVYSGQLYAADTTQIATISGTSDPSDPPTVTWSSGETTTWAGP